jgi:hypothetical protein
LLNEEKFAMLSKKSFLALCCCMGIALPLAVLAQMAKPPTPENISTPTSSTIEGFNDSHLPAPDAKRTASGQI